MKKKWTPKGEGEDKMKDKKIVFMGTPTFAVPVLTSLIENYNVVLVVSQPDREKDRKGNILPTPTKQVAINYDIPVYQPIKVKEEYEEILKYNPDIIITCAYGQIIPSELLDYPEYGCVNVHGSLLPKLRGGAPIHWAIINGDTETGITIMYMDEKMDSGDIIATRSMPINENDKLDYVYENMSYLGRDLLMETLPLIFNKENKRIKQDESLVTYGLNIKKEEEKIDFNKNSKDVHNLIRGLSSVPGAYTTIENKRMKVYESFITDKKSTKEPGTIVDINKEGIFVTTKDYVIKLTDIKLEGKKRCLVKDFINGIKKEEFIGKKFMQ